MNDNDAKRCRLHSDCDGADVLSRGVWGTDAKHEALPDSDEVAALKADNAALFGLLRKHAQRVLCPRCGGIGSRSCAVCDHGEIEHFRPEVKLALASPHPGAALLERMKKLEAAAREVDEWLSTSVYLDDMPNGLETRLKDALKP